MAVSNMDHWISLIHVSPRYNAASINRHGLLLARASPGAPIIWLAAPITELLAVEDCQQRWGVSAVTVYTVCIPRRWVRRYRPNIWACLHDIRRYRMHVLHRVAKPLCLP